MYCSAVTLSEMFKGGDNKSSPHLSVKDLVPSVAVNVWTICSSLKRRVLDRSREDRDIPVDKFFAMIANGATKTLRSRPLWESCAALCGHIIARSDVDSEASSAVRGLAAVHHAVRS